LRSVTPCSSGSKCPGRLTPVGFLAP
jgi:hypothetical protein